MVKGKLYLLLSALSLGKEIRVDRDKASIDELFRELQELSHQLPKTLAMASSSGGGQRHIRDERTPEKHTRRGRSTTPATSGSVIDHSRLPPEVAAVLARTPRTGAAMA